MADQGGMTDFAEFVAEQQPRLRAYVGRLPGAQYAEMDDLLQEALLRAYEHRDRFDSDAHAVNWICQVVRNLLVDRRRRWLRRPVLPYADLDHTGDETAPDPADLVVAAEQARLAVDAVGALSSVQRELLWEHVVDGVSYAEIARRTATPLATVRSLAHRARVAAVREFARAGGALSVLPALLVRSWRRAAHRVHIPSATAEALSLGLSVLVVTAVAVPPVVATPPVVHWTLPASRVAASGPTAPRRAPAPRTVTTDAARTAPESPPPPSPAPPHALRIQAGDFSGTYSSDCTFSPTGTKILDEYSCDFTAASDRCQFTPIGSTAGVTGCSVELVWATTKGTADGFSPTSDIVAAHDCQSVSYTAGVVRFRSSPDADPTEFAVAVYLDRASAKIDSDGGAPVIIHARFPFLCSMPHQRDQIGLQGTLS